MTRLGSDLVRDAGYETLFFLGGHLAPGVDPGGRKPDRIVDWLHGSKSRREHLRRLEKRGLVAPGVLRGRWVPRLTELGRAAFAGGRHPEGAWNRAWDGAWRLLTFDLPRQEGAARMKLRRWLDSGHFGRLQGSVWISPDPVDNIGEVLRIGAIDPAMILVFEGGPAGGRTPQEVAAQAWDFEAINAGYRSYCEGALRILKQVQRRAASMARLRAILDEDRKHWWEAVRRDPLLPGVLHPGGYLGREAWAVRGNLFGFLGAVTDTLIS